MSFQNENKVFTWMRNGNLDIELLFSLAISANGFILFLFFPFRFSFVIYNFVKNYLGYVQFLFFYTLILFVEGLTLKWSW